MPNITPLLRLLPIVLCLVLAQAPRIHADDLPAFLVGVWMSAEDVADNENAASSAAVYLSEDGVGMMVGCCPPVGTGVITSYDSSTNNVSMNVIAAGEIIAVFDLKYDPSDESLAPVQYPLSKLFQVSTTLPTSARTEIESIQPRTLEEYAAAGSNQGNGVGLVSQGFSPSGHEARVEQADFGSEKSTQISIIYSNASCGATVFSADGLNLDLAVSWRNDDTLIVSNPNGIELDRHFGEEASPNLCGFETTLVIGR